jgi:hypothetical protein
MEHCSAGVLKLKRFEFRVPSYGLKYCKLNSAVHYLQHATRVESLLQYSSTPTLQILLFKRWG